VVQNDALKGEGEVYHCRRGRVLGRRVQRWARWSEECPSRSWRRVTRESHSVTLAERGREILDLGNRTPPIGSL